VGSLGSHPVVNGPGTEFGEITGARLVSFGADYIHCNRQCPTPLRASFAIQPRIALETVAMPIPSGGDRETWRMAQELTFA
jgi:hypothetical protein